jgi:hypothetical protein
MNVNDMYLDTLFVPHREHVFLIRISTVCCDIRNTLNASCGENPGFVMVGWRVCT